MIGNFKLLLVGAGEMGGALLDGWLKGGVKPENVLIVDPSKDVKAKYFQKSVIAVESDNDIPKNFLPDVVFLAVTPQIMHKIAPLYKKYKENGAIFVTIAAGKEFVFYEDILGKEAQIIRCMPNTPVSVMKGVLLTLANQAVKEERRLQVSTLLNLVGNVVWLRDEKMLNAATAVSGSGPAYVFHLVEAMAKAGVNAGLPEYMANELASLTVCGSGEMLSQSLESAKILRENVCTPGGSTAAAFDYLLDEKGGLTQLMTKSIKNAIKRSEEMS